MLRLYKWIGIPDEVIELISNLMELRKTRFEIWSKGEKMTSRWIKISCGFLQGDSYSPVGLCKIPVCRLLQESRRYRMGPPGNRDASRTHSLFVDDLKVYQESHEMSMKLLYKQVTILEHVMVYRNVQRSHSIVERCSEEKN